MKVLSSLEIAVVVQELQILINARVDQIYQPDNTESIIALHRSDIGKKLVRIIPGTALCISSKKRASPKESLNFCRFLRKRLGSTRLKEITQKRRERIVELHFEGKESSFILIAEFFSKGNLILCDKGYIIISALEMQVWKDRKIKAKIKYEYPPERKSNFADFEEFNIYLQENKKENIVKTIALGMNLGGVYAEELCFRADIPKETKDPTEKQMQELFTQYQLLLKEDTHPNIVDGIPYPFKMHSLGEGKTSTSYNEALDQYYAQFIPEEEEEQKEERAKRRKYDEILVEQEKQKLQIEKAIDENKRKGEYIYSHYMEIKEAFDLCKEKKFEELKKKGIEREGKNILLEIQ